MKTVNLCGVELSDLGRDGFFERILSCLKGKESCFVSKVNTEFLVRAINDKVFMKTLNDSSFSISDGRGVLWAVKFLSLPFATKKLLMTLEVIWQMIYSGAAIVFNPKYITYPISENIPGVDALKIMLRAADETSVGVFFFGASQHDLDAAMKNIQREMPRLKIAGSLNGYDFQEDSMMDPVSIINETGAKLLVVALGSPLQEYWIRDNLGKLTSVRIAVGEGGSLAFLAGTLKRAPRWAQKVGLEWLWRLFMNRSLTHQTGSRLKRVWNAVPVFIYEVVKWKIKYGATEIE